VVERDDHDDDGEHDNRDEGVSEKPEGFATKVAEGFALRDFSSIRHWCQRVDYCNVARGEQLCVTSFGVFGCWQDRMV